MTRRRPSRFARPLIVLSVAACAALAAPALAQANSTVAYNGAVLSYVGEDGVNNVATVSLNAAATTYTITDSENITTASPGCTGSGTQTVTCTATTSQDDEVLIDGLGGNDTLMVDTQAAPIDDQPDSVDMGSDDVSETGNDRVDFSRYTKPDGDSRITAGPGNDVEIAGSASTTFEMGNVADGSDQLIGGPEPDEADYGNRTAALALNAADGLANDGETGENDNIGATVDELDGGAGNDILTAAPVAGADLTGGAGNDALTGGPGEDRIEGGAGINVISAGGGDDFVFGSLDGTDTVDGGPGDDVIDAGTGADDLRGGDGFDFVEIFGGQAALLGSSQLPNLSVTLDDVANDGAPGQGANIHSDIEDLETGDGNDTVVGSGAPEQIFTLGGNDTVSPGGGSDQVSSGAGDDTVNARDGIFDRISCGDGTDSVTVDNVDALSACENVSSLAVPAIQGPRDRKAAKVTVSRLAKRLARKKFLRSGLSLRVKPSEPVRLFFTLTGRARGARISRPGDVVVAMKSLGQSGRARTVRLKPSRHLRFARQFKLRLQLLAIDAGGNPTNLSRTISVR
jgi:Ca2+-binding RTX toxin-like protein